MDAYVCFTALVAAYCDFGRSVAKREYEIVVVLAG